MKTCDTIWRNARLVTMAGGAGVLPDGAVAVEGGKIVFAGPLAEMPAFRAAREIDCGDRLLTPAPIDCHTHLVYGGDRAREFELRLEGAGYEQIAREGGGIASTVRDTTSLSVDALVDASLRRLDHLIGEGVTTVEIKSGYGLTVEAELDMLRAARRLGEIRPVRVVTTYLAAHAVPPRYKGRNDAYIDEVALPGMRAAKAEGLLDAVDGFCEGIAFSVDEIARVFDLAAELDIPVKLHAEQLSHLGGARLAARYGALSADHLEYITPEDAVAMAAAGTVATLLPGAFYTLRETQHPPVDALRKAGARMALATDSNPGTSPVTSILLTMNMGATLFRLTVDECFAGITREAAAALGLSHEIGTLEVGKSADLAIWDARSPAELVYRIGFNPLHSRVFKGEITHG